MCTWLQHGLYCFSNYPQPRLSYRVNISLKNKYRAIAGRKHFKYEVRPQIRNTVFLGILYGLIDTLPMVCFSRHFLRPSNTTLIVSYLLVFNIPPVGYEIWFTLRVCDWRMVRSVYGCVHMLGVRSDLCVCVCNFYAFTLFDVVSLSLSPFLLSILNCSAGTSFACAINRMNNYLLLAIMM